MSASTSLAIRQHAFGPPDVMELTEVERPQPRPTEVLVEVRACGVNPVDWMTRQGVGVLRELPFTVGWDISGVAAQVGDAVTRFSPGDEVYGMPHFPREASAYATHVTAPTRQLALKSRHHNHEAAAGLPLAGLTAWQLLVDTADVRDGHRVLITGAGGGVGHLAVQIALARGAEVVAVASQAKHPMLHDLGVQDVHDYDSAQADPVESVDVVLDAIGGPDTVRWLNVLRPGGLLLPTTGADDQLDVAILSRGFRLQRLLVEPDGHGLEQLAALVDQGRLRVVVDDALPLKSAPEAHRRGEMGRIAGKLVLTAP